jgi:phosphate:Na+ symporter
MSSVIIGLLGGVGLFLLGMTLLTEGLRAFAGDSLRRALLQFTDKPVKAFFSGALATAIVQSSSATTVTMIGFVSAGLLTFPQALGVVLGASLGTTSTGWLVAGLGLKVSVGYYALPLIGVGAFLRLLAPPRWRSFGIALAGFGLIFVGIDHLQDAMRGSTAFVDLTTMHATTLPSRLLIVLTGMFLTVLMQSSSAAVATTMTALHSHSITLDQAALVVIGASIGTTITGVLASLGASVPAKRTALGMVLFTTGTGMATFVLLPWLLQMLSALETLVGMDAAPLRLAAFHTSFVITGIAIVLPFTAKFARQVERMLPDKGPALTANLDDSLLSLPVVALEAVRRALRSTALVMIELLLRSLREIPPEQDIERVEQALNITRDFFSRIPPQAGHANDAAARAAVLHALDHLVRLEAYIRPPASVHSALGGAVLRHPVEMAIRTLEFARNGIRGELANGWAEDMQKKAKLQGDWNRRERPLVLQRTANGQSDPNDALNALDAMRWLARAVDHVARVCHYLAEQPDGESLAEHERHLV